MPIKPKEINITVDLTRPGVVNTQKEMTYGDKNLLTVTITDGGNVVDLSTIGAITTDLVVKRLAGAPIDVLGEILDGKAVFTLDGSSLSIPGYTEAAIQFYDADGGRISTARFGFTSIRDLSADAVGDSLEQTIIQKVLFEGPDRIQEAIDATAAAEAKTLELETVIEENTITWLNEPVQTMAELPAASSNFAVAAVVLEPDAQGRYKTVRSDGTTWQTIEAFTPTQYSAISRQLDDLEGQFDAAVGAVTVDSEVVLARQSTVKGKTFTTLDGRLEELDNDTYFPMKNDISNGDFSNGTTGWTGFNTSYFNVLSNEANVLFNASTGNIRTSNFSANLGDKIFVKVEVKASSNLVNINVSGSLGVAFHSGNNNYEKLSSISTATATLHHLRISDNRTSGWDEVKVKYAIYANLSQIFGTGNEPSKEEMDKILAFYPNSFFSGTVNLAENKKMLKFLLNEIRSKASKVREAYNNPTFQNGASGTVQFRVNDMGRLEFKGTLIVTGTGTAFNLPSTHRPASTTYATIASATGMAILTINANGNVSVSQAGTFFTSPVSVAL